MAKRSAEKQLTKDSRSDDEDDSGEQTGFRRADEKTLSGRVIRGMPKRAGGTPLGSFTVDKPVATPGTPTPAPKFAGFGSFTSPSGGEASGSSPSFGAKTFPFPAAKPPSMAFATSNPTPPLTPSSDGGEDDLFKYYSKLRGLNVSIMDACKKAVQADPFVDLSSIFKQYNDHRASIEKTRTAAPQPAASPLKSVNGSAPASSASSDIPKPPAVPSSFAFSPFPSASTPAPAPKLTAPSAPPSFAPFLPLSASSSAAATSTTPTTTPSTTTTTTESPAKSAFSFGSKSAFSFGAPAATTGTDKETKSGFSFGAPSTSTTSTEDKSTAKSAFSFDKPSSFSTGTEDKGTTKSGFSFGAPSASSGWPTASSTGDAAKSTESKPLSSFFGTSPSTFGSSSLFSSPSSTPTAAAAPTGSDTSPSAKPAFSFGFGSSASPFAPANLKGSLGNPVGFSFGAASKAAAAESEGTGSAASGAEESSQGETPAAEGAPITLEPSAYDKEGAGEEDEETTYSERCKAYKLGKKDGAAEWIDLGVGMLRCKKHKSTDVRRVLMRGSGSGRVILNFVVFASLKPTQQKKDISFVAMDDGEPASFRLRVKNEAQAVALKEALLKEVEAVAAKKA